MISIPLFVSLAPLKKLEVKTMHYAKVVKIRILKCPTLTNNFSVVFHPGCPKFYVELCKLPKNIEKRKQNWSGKRGKKCKKHEGGVCEGQDWSQKNCLDKPNDICFMHFLRKHPLIAKKWSQSLKKSNSKYFEPIF